jgi:retron-type reverse transcriptase
MGLFDFLKRLFGGPPRKDPPGFRFDAIPPKPGSTPRPPAPVPPQSSAGWMNPPPAPPTPAPARPAPASPAWEPPQRREVRLDLDASTFTPLSHDQVKAQFANAPVQFNAAFGRRDRIPPADDPRTKLIDRAMVGQGFITPEQLAQIHEVGTQYDAARPDYAQVAAAAQAAVARSKEERARLKAEKKAAAARKREERAAAIAQRKATDIVYLGRGVSGGLADRRSDVEKLTAAGLPVLATPADVAAALGVPVPRLRWLAFHADAATVDHYVRFPVPKKSGGERWLASPHRDLAAAQRWVLEHVLAKPPSHDAAHGFVPGRSTVTNARPHAGAAVVVNLDLRDFFPSITFPRVEGAFRHLGYSPAVAAILALLCTEAPRTRVEYAGRPYFVAAGPRSLPQGACTSPALSNLVARRLDARLSGLARRMGWTYTRYADDLTFSTTDAEQAKANVGYVLARVRHVAQDESFAVNEAKTRVLKPSARQAVTGLVVNRGVAAPRKLRRQLRAVLHDARKTGRLTVRAAPGVDPAGWVHGMLGYVSMANPAQGEKLRRGLPELPGT